MRAIPACLGLFGWGLLLVTACSGSAGDLFTPGGGNAGVTGLGGRGGRGGTGNIGGRGGSGVGGEAGSLDGGLEDGGLDGDAGVACDGGCDDGNDCTVDICDANECRHPLAEEGALCGSDRNDECTTPDSCDAQGECLPNDAPNGSECNAGSCTLGECIEGQPVGCPALVVPGLPFSTGWRTVGGVNLYNGACDVANTPDFAVVFTAPAAGAYLIEAAGELGTNDPEGNGDEASNLADSVLTIAAGACGGLGAPEINCNDDIAAGQLDSSIRLELADGETITIYVNEYGEVVPGGGSGTLSITLVDP